MSTRAQKPLRLQRDTSDILHAFRFSPGCWRPPLHSRRFRRCVQGDPQRYNGLHETYSSVLNGGHKIHKSTPLTSLHFLSFFSDEKPQTLYQEAVVWKHLAHPNIVPLLGITSTPLQLISEWMPCGGLIEYVREIPDVDRLGLVGVPRPCIVSRLSRS